MAIRFPGTHHEFGMYGETFGGGNLWPGSIDAGDNRFLAWANISMFCSPSRYSEVRKVAFWVSLRHEHTGTQPVDEVKLHIVPDVSVLNGTDPAPVYEILPSTVHDSNAFNAVGAVGIASRYDTPTQRNQIVPEKIGANATNGHSGLLYVEYERFTNDPGSIKFFEDWDTWVAEGNDDGYTFFRPVIERVDLGDGGTWSVGTGSNAHPAMIASFGMCIVQTGSANNRLCTYLGHGRPLMDHQNDMTPTFSTNVLEQGYLEWDPAEWDGVTAIHCIGYQTKRTGANANGGVEIRTEKVEDDTTGPATVVGSTESIGTASSANGTSLFRTKNLLTSDIEDGAKMVLNHRTNGVAGTDRPMWFWEIIQSGATKSGVRMQPAATQQRGSQIGSPPEWGRGASYFDPLWFEDMLDERFLAKNIQHSLYQGSGTNDPETQLWMNAFLDESPVTSTFNTHIAPSRTCTPCGTAGWKTARVATTGSNPVDLAGKRQLNTLFAGSIWLSGTAARPGWSALEYILDLPDSETLGIGPVFELDTFNPEGCASTAAGLGDNPGVLAITNGSTPPKKFDPRAQQISNLGIQTPFCDEVPSTLAEDTASSPTGGLELGTYIYRYTFRNSCTGKESDPNPDDISVDTSGQTPAAKVTLSFAGVRVPNDPQIDQICVYRTLVGGAFPIMAQVGCFDFSVTTSFVDTLADSELDFTNNPLSLLNGFAPCAPIVAEFRNRLFLMGDIPQLSPEGTVDAVQDSDILTFSEDAEVDRCMVGRFIQLEGDCKAYEIEKVLPSVANSPANMRVKLTEEYEGSSSTFNKFIICGRPNRIYVSEPLEPDYWPAANFIDVEPGDGDRIMGAVSNFNGLVICKRRKTYVLRFSLDPAGEVLVPARVSSDIGCIGPRTFAQAANGSYWLADRGIAMFDGRGVQHIPQSDQANDIFVNPENPRYVRRDRNGRVIGAIGAFYPKREQYLLLLPTVQTNRGANLMLVYDTSLQNITYYEFCQEFVSMEVAKDADGNERVYVGDTNGFVWILDVGDTDGVGLPNATGTVRGTVTSAGVDSSGASFLVDSTASFLAGGLPGAASLSGVEGLSGFTGEQGLALAGACLYTRSASAGKDEPWTVRTIFASTQTKIYVSPSWGDDQPEVGDDYMLGPIKFLAEFKPTNYETDDIQKRDWQQVLTHIPESVASELRVELIPDLQNSDPEEDTVIDPVTMATGKGRVFRMDHPTGRQIAPVGRLIHNFQQIRFSNFAPEEPIRVLNHTMRLTPRR